MNEKMSETERLRKEIAERLGWTKLECCISGDLLIGHPPSGESWHQYEGTWHRANRVCKVPDWTHDMGLCFRHLVPGLRGRYGDTVRIDMFYSVVEAKLTTFRVHWMQEPVVPFGRYFSHQGSHINPAMAFCIAFLKAMRKKGGWGDMSSITTVKEPCKCCGGSGVQHNTNTGQVERCNCCGGTGQWDPYPGPKITWTGKDVPQGSHGGVSGEVG
jgi:hypothetical protein